MELRNLRTYTNGSVYRLLSMIVFTMQAIDS